MGETFLEKAEQEELFRQKQKDNSGLVFATQGSAGANPLKLAQIISTFDFIINILGWKDKPLANLPQFLTQYQASIDAKYHNDFKEIQIAKEIEKKRQRRTQQQQGISIIQE